MTEKQDIAELAKRVLAMRVINPEYNHIHANQARAIYRKYALEAAPKLAQAVMGQAAEIERLKVEVNRLEQELINAISALEEI